jgi:hypothetical protein
VFVTPGWQLQRIKADKCKDEEPMYYRSGRSGGSTERARHSDNYRLYRELIEVKSDPAGSSSWLSWTSGPVELGRYSELTAESACSVGVSGGWHSSVSHGR